MEYKENTKNNRKKTIIATACSLAAVFVIGIFSVFFLSQPQVDSLISLDVNPGIEISTGNDDRVLECRALNDDAVKVLDDMDLKGVTLNVASNAIIGSMVKQGYLTTDGSNTILVSVANEDADKAARLQQELSQDINTVLKQQGIQATVLQQAESTSTDDLKSFANQYGISIGKADFIQKLIAKDSTLDAATLAGMSIKELSALIVERGINISDIVTEYDDDLDDMIEDTIEDTNEMNGVGDDIYCEYCGQLKSICKNSCDRSGGERYCDDCGRLKSICQDRCKYQGGGNGNGNGNGYGNGNNGTTSNSSSASSTPSSNSSSQAASQAPSGNTSSASSGNGNGYGYGNGSGNGNGYQHHHGWDDDDWDDDWDDDDDFDYDEFCEYCGRRETECRNSCDRSGGERYCDNCGRLKSECRDRCDD